MWKTTAVPDHYEIWQKGEIYNIGSDSEMENIIVVEEICDILGEILPISCGNFQR